MSRKSTLSLCFLILILIGQSVLQIFPVEAAAGDHTLELDCDKPYYYLKGQAITAYARSNISIAVTLRIYWNWKTFSENQLVYSNTKNANATWMLPTTAIKVGYYKIVANTTRQTITIWRTLVNVKDFIPATLPFSYVWQNINYTMYGSMLSAQSQGETLNITYPRIPVAFTANFLHNNMTFLIRLNDADWAVDVTYMAQYCGLKWTINGTFSQAGTYSFQCDTNPLSKWKHVLDRWQSGNYLTFCWEDLGRAAQHFSWNATSKTLFVDIPASFSIDPYIFQDGFEGAPYAAWTGTVIGSGMTLVQSSTVKHNGANSSKSITDGSGKAAYCYKDYTTATNNYLRFYVYISSDTGTGFLPFGAFFQTAMSSQTLCAVGIIGSTRTINLFWTDDTWTDFNDASATTLATGTWHCLELWTHKSATVGTIYVYLNGVEVADLRQTNIKFNWALHRIGVGCPMNQWRGAHTNYVDCVVYDTAYIGPEVSGENFAFTLATASSSYTSSAVVKALKFQESSQQRTLASLLASWVKLFSFGVQSGVFTGFGLSWGYSFLLYVVSPTLISSTIVKDLRFQESSASSSLTSQLANWALNFKPTSLTRTFAGISFALGRVFNLNTLSNTVSSMLLTKNVPFAVTGTQRTTASILSSWNMIFEQPSLSRTLANVAYSAEAVFHLNAESSAISGTLSSLLFSKDVLFNLPEAQRTIASVLPRWSLNFDLASLSRTFSDMIYGFGRTFDLSALSNTFASRIFNKDMQFILPQTQRTFVVNPFETAAAYVVPIGPGSFSSSLSVLFKTYQDGKPLPDVEIKIYETVFNSLVDSAVTDTTGRATIYLPPGEYRYEALHAPTNNTWEGHFLHYAYETIEIDFGKGEAKITSNLVPVILKMVTMLCLTAIGCIYIWRLNKKER